MTTNIFAVPAKGVGRIDYSSAVAIAVESAVTGWQESFYARRVVSVPALDSLVVRIDLDPGSVAVVSDFFASIPSNRLIRLEVLRETGPAVYEVIYDFIEYQQIQKHLVKPNYWTVGVAFRVHNYNNVVENNMVVGCAGYRATVEEYTQLLRN